ncbi:uncharacterized protein TNCV_4431391 [Trichonephila clavipes]|nr:uncharacterized protein TNCV_4431391 [Trichonephila clavipes]
MAPHTITPTVRAVCRCTAKAGLRHLSQGLHTRTRLSSLLRWKLDSSLKTTWFHSTVVQFLRVWHHSKRRLRWMGVKRSTRNGHHDPKCPSAKRLRIVREDTWAYSEDATSNWMAAYEAVGCTCAFLTVCRGCPGPGLRVNDTLGFTGPNSSSQHNQSGLINKLHA